MPLVKSSSSGIHFPRRSATASFGAEARERPFTRASAAGAKIVMHPTQMHGTTVAIIVDPTGAPVALAEWPASGKEAK